MGNCQQALNTSQAEIEKGSSSEEGIFLTLKIWTKKSNELFNYEAQQYRELKYDLTNLGSLPKQLRHLFQRNPDDGLMIFNPNSIHNATNNTQQSRGFLSKWVNLRSINASEGIQIRENDTYKLGNTIIKISEIYFCGDDSKQEQAFREKQQRYNSRASTDFASTRGRTQTIQDQYQKSSYTSMKNVSPCGSQRGSTLAIQKATTMIHSASRYLRTEEHFDDENNLSNNNIDNHSNYSSQPDEKDIKLTLDPTYIHDPRKRKKQHTHHMVAGTADASIAKQCRICLDTQSKSEINENYNDEIFAKEQDDFFDDAITAGQTVEQMISKINKETSSGIQQSCTLHDFELERKRTQQQQQQRMHGQYSNHIQNKNPMISICSCAGSLKYVHLQCLQTWVKSKQHLTDAFRSKVCDFYSHKALTCELCKKPYPLKININGELVYLLQNIAEDDSLQPQVIIPNNPNNNNNNQVLEENHANNHSVEPAIQQQQSQQIAASNFNDQDVGEFVGQAGYNIANDNEEEEEVDEDNDDDNEDEEEEDGENSQDESGSDGTISSSERRKYANFLILELSNTTNASLNGLVIVNLARTSKNQTKSVLTIGRQNACDIKINDIAMSRFHAELHVDYENFRVFLKDTNSKFGTLLHLRNQLVINKRLTGVQVQINNFCLEFAVGINPMDEFDAKIKRERFEQQQQQQSTKKNSMEIYHTPNKANSTCCQTWKNGKQRNAFDDVTNPEAEIVIADRTSNFVIHRDRDYFPIPQLHNLNPFSPAVPRD